MKNKVEFLTRTVLDKKKLITAYEINLFLRSRENNQQTELERSDRDVLILETKQKILSLKIDIDRLEKLLFKKISEYTCE